MGAGYGLVRTDNLSVVITCPLEELPSSEPVVGRSRLLASDDRRRGRQLRTLPLWVRFEGASRRLFKLFGTLITQRRVTPDPVVKSFDVIEHARPGLAPGRVLFQVNPLFL